MNAKISFVTGASGGLGQAIARAFLRESPQNFVWLGYRSHPGHLQPLEEEFPERCRPLQIDVTDPGAWRQAVDTILGQRQQLDVLVNNAGLHQDCLLPQMPVNTWKEVLATNLDAAFYGCQAVLPAMISRKYGRIVNIASLSALLAPPGQTNYAAAKAGLVALTQSLAKEVARLGITVNAVCPGFVETDTLASMPPEERKNALAQIPMRRFGRPEEIAAAVRFLASPDASYITGAILKIDGGIF